MSTPCRPCDLLACVPPNDLETYNLDGIPPRPLPPVIPPVPPSFGNDTLFWCCECPDDPFAYPSIPLESESETPL